MTTATPRYPKDRSAFWRTLQARVDAYFDTRPRYADGRMVAKGAVCVGAAVLLYALVLSGRFTGWGLFASMTLFGFSQFLIAVNVAHDASHGAYSKRPWVNRLLTRVFDLVGINSYMWNIGHLRAHHRQPNVPGVDTAIDSFRFMRLHPRAPAGRAVRYQHLYIFGIYAFATLYKLLWVDFQSFARRWPRGHSAPARQVVLLIASKLFVFAYALVLPLVMSGAPAVVVVAGFLCGHFVSGVAIGLIFQVTHVVDDTLFVEPDETGALPYPWAEHLLRTTADFAPTSRAASWVTGGLHLHVAHHLFPGVCHVHLPALTEIVGRTAREHGLPYRSYPDTFSAVRSHLRLLRRLGRAEVRAAPGRHGAVSRQGSAAPAVGSVVYRARGK